MQGNSRFDPSRRLARDIRRLTDYYTTIEREIKKKIEQRHLTGEEAERELGKVEATQRELANKLTEQRARYAMTIRLEPVAVLSLWHTVMRLRLTLLRLTGVKSALGSFRPSSERDSLASQQQI